MKKIIAILLLLPTFAFSKCLVGVGLEGSGSSNSAYSEPMAGQIQRSFKTVAAGVKCGAFTLSTTDLGGINDGYEVVVGGVKTHIDVSRWTIGGAAYTHRTGSFEIGLGGSVSKIKTYSANGRDSYYQPHLVVGLAHKSGLAVFNSFGWRNGSLTMTTGFYLTF